MDTIRNPQRRLVLRKILEGVGYGAFEIVAWSAYLSQSQAKSLILRPLWCNF